LLPHLGSTGAIGSIAASFLGPNCRAVRAILFDKTATTNWSLGWHQDRTIAVRERIDVAGFGPWTVKHGIAHVEPPFGLLDRMVTLRAHLDAVPAKNSPLLIAPGSHKLGRIPVSSVAEVARHCGTVACLADRGDVWLYATAILHASDAAVIPGHRRVLQVDFATDPLPDRLQWLGV
jgi:ectoine hydroxylase-related dioxygenase (phytanoyl-CoA dioxygenase family)